jgi:hypothetical protein
MPYLSALILSLLLTGVLHAQTNVLRYVTPNAQWGTRPTVPLWSSPLAPELCFDRWLRAGQPPEEHFDCNVNGWKGKLGEVVPGTRVELLWPSSFCDDMAHVRILSGPLANTTGCIPADALTSIAPTPR